MVVTLHRWTTLHNVDTTRTEICSQGRVISVESNQIGTHCTIKRYGYTHTHTQTQKAYTGVNEETGREYSTHGHRFEYG
jgi:DUF1009 family protein